MSGKVQPETKILLGVALGFILIGFIGVVTWFLDDTIAPLLWNSRIERLGETNLPRATIETGNIVYCRMKADDFRFALPVGLRATNLIITNGGFDTVHGSVEVYFDGTRQFARIDGWPGKIQIGGSVSSEPIAGGLLIHFDYFGDK